MDGFVNLVRDLLLESGVSSENIYHKRRVELPGFFRAEKKWDLLAMVDGQLIAAIEFKSQIGPSISNNCNNRAEEAIGNATDLWTAYREGAFQLSARPWLGYFMLLEDKELTRRPISVREPHFKIFDAYRDASYADRYEQLMVRLIRERLYDGACFITSGEKGGKRGDYTEPSKQLSFKKFAREMIARTKAHLDTL